MNSRIKHLISATITAFFTSYCAVTSQESQLLSNYETETGLKFPQSIIDLACFANTFPSKLKKQQDETNICFTQVLKNYTEIKQINGLVYDDIDQSFVFNAYPSLGIKGFHLKLFEEKKNDEEEETTKSVFIVIRHQEHESMLTDEMNEMMSLFGPAATVDREQGNKEVFGASVVSSIIRFTRQQLGLDYLPQAISMFHQIQSHYQEKSKDTKYIFTGFSAGGLYAIVLALYFHSPAITFSATGVEDIVKIYYSNLFTNQSIPPPIYNFAHELDRTPQLDCQLGTLCLYQAEKGENQPKLTDEELESIHLNTIFGEGEPHIIRWFHEISRWKCTAADNYNLIHGSCQRERSRWKDRLAKQDL